MVQRGGDGGLETEVLRQWPRLVGGPIQEGLVRVRVRVRVEVRVRAIGLGLGLG